MSATQRFALVLQTLHAVERVARYTVSRSSIGFCRNPMRQADYISPAMELAYLKDAQA